MINRAGRLKGIVVSDFWTEKEKDIFLFAEPFLVPPHQSRGRVVPVPRPACPGRLQSQSSLPALAGDGFSREMLFPVGPCSKAVGFELEEL